MANNKSAKKRIKLSKRNNLQNRYYKSTLNTMFKKLEKLVKKYEDEDKTLSLNELVALDRECQSKIDKAVKKNMLHKNTAARRKIKLARLMYNIRNLEFSAHE